MLASCILFGSVFVGVLSQLNDSSVSTNVNGTTQSNKTEDASLSVTDYYPLIDLHIEDPVLSCPKDYECIPKYLCNSENIAPDNLMKCGYALDVCCQVRTKPENATISNRGSAESSQCGRRNVDGVGFIIGGPTINSETHFGEFPWMVAILVRNYTEVGEISLYKGGGALIHPSVVLTAAHLVSGIQTNLITVRAGEWDTETTNEIREHQDRGVGQVLIHPDFNAANLRNDIALVFLTEAMHEDQHINTICLPPQNAVINHQKCIATGWGKESNRNEAKYSPILKKIQLPIVPLDTCEQLLRKTRLSQYFELHESFVCAGGEEDKDTCRGDGGSPLACPIEGTKDRYYQAGVVAWGIGCGGENVPGVYVNVAKFRNWIDKSLVDKGLSSHSYNYNP